MRAMSADLEGGVETVKAFWILYAMVLIDSVQAAVSTPHANHQRRLSAAISDTPHRQDQSMLVNVHLEGYVTCSVFGPTARMPCIANLEEILEATYCTVKSMKTSFIIKHSFKAINPYDR